MTPYAYSASFESLRDALHYALNEHPLPFDQAIGYVIEDQHLLDGDTSQRALAFTALATIAVEQGFLEAPETRAARSANLSELLSEFCADENAAAAALEKRDDRQAFLHDIRELRASLGMS